MMRLAAFALVLAGRMPAAPVLPTLPKLPTDALEAAVFGIKGDGTTDNSVAFQKALDSAAKRSAVLRVKSASKAYLTGPLVMKGSVELRLETGTTLQMLPYGKYPAKADGSYAPLLAIDGATDLALTGRGTIDGNGGTWWSGYDAGTITKRPGMLTFTKVQRVLLKDIHLQNAPNVHISFHYQVTDVTVQGISITAPDTSPNTDGCDLEGRRFLFDRDTIQVGDDNIAIQPGHDSTSDVTVQDCFLGVGHGLSIGSWCGYGVRDLLAQRITFKGTTSGIRMKAGRDRGGMVRDLVYTDITMTDVQYPLYITSYYPSSPATTALDTFASVTPTTPRWQNVRVTNLTSTSSLKGHNSVVIYAVPEMPADSLTLTNVHITAPNAFSIQHSHDMLFTGVTYNGSSSGLFGTSRDVTYRKAPTVSLARKPSATSPHRLRTNGQSLLRTGGVIGRDVRANGSRAVSTSEQLGNMKIEGTSK